jgi:hypothetical protein
VGLGLAAIAPVTFGAAGRAVGTTAGQGIAIVAGIGYLGFLTGPPMIGFLADALSLSAALVVVVMQGTLIATLAQLIAWKSPSTSEEDRLLPAEAP